MQKDQLDTLKQLQKQIKADQAQQKKTEQKAAPSLTTESNPDAPTDTSFGEVFDADQPKTSSTASFSDLISGVQRVHCDQVAAPTPSEKLAKLKSQDARKISASGVGQTSSPNFGPVRSELSHESAVGAETVLGYKSTTLPQGIYSQLKRGELEPVFVLDLHGINSEEAYIEVELLLEATAKQRSRVAQIIHGKGTHAALKNHVNQWLKKSQQVLAFCSAPPQFGGSGSVLVLVKRPSN